MRWRSRLTNTAATRERSSGRPVSFSTIEASVTSASGVLTGTSGAAPLPDLLQHAAMRLLHALDRLLARRAAREIVGLRQQRAFLRDLADIAGEEIDLGEPRDDLLGGQPFGNREGVLHHLALDDRLDRLAQGDLLGELVLAVFQVLARLEHQHAADEHPRLVDDVLARQQIGDLAQAEPARNIDDLLAIERTRRPRTCACRTNRRARRAIATSRMIVKIALPAMTSGWRARRDGRFGSGTYSGSSAARGLRGATRFGSPERARRSRACVGHVHSRAVWRRLSPNMAKG